MDEPVLAYAIQAARRTVDLGRRLLVGIQPERFARFPQVGGEVIRTNHPAFIYGHLSLYPAKLLAIHALETTEAQTSSQFETLFQRESACHDDADGGIYPSMSEITDVFFRAWDSALTRLAQSDARSLAAPNPDPRLAQTFPTVGFATVFLLCNHTATHLGQVSAWRRCIGLPPA